jgi:hypothetical protein
MSKIIPSLEENLKSQGWSRAGKERQETQVCPDAITTPPNAEFSPQPSIAMVLAGAAENAISDRHKADRVSSSCLYFTFTSQ